MQIIDFLLTVKRNAQAALRLFHQAIRQHCEPVVVTIDISGANTAAFVEFNAGRAKDDGTKQAEEISEHPDGAGPLLNQTHDKDDDGL